jgi:pyridinium-3,5-bisthiocarboxylic acid mononucleotide nickel chelatase
MSASTTTAWFHCFSGISGDMALGSLIDAGADLDEIRTLLGRLPFTGWQLNTEMVLRGGISCTRALVDAPDDGSERRYRDIVDLVEHANLPPRVVARSLAVFAALAHVEARIHRSDLAEVHFHEVGGHDAIVDVIGVACALEILGIDEVCASAVATGTGDIRSAHGLLPNPAPAVVRLLEGAPTYGRPVGVELTTPTGAALLRGLGASFGPLPAMEIRSSGFGAGGRDLEALPNCTQVIVGTTSAAQPGAGQPVLLLEANLDDATGEQLANALSALLDSGAHDAWLSPVVMKKGRPGHVVHVLVDPSRAVAVREVLTVTTGTFGVRSTSLERWPLAREMGVVHVEGHPVGIKASGQRVKAEFADVTRVAESLGLGVQQVASLAEQAWREQRRAE